MLPQISGHSQLLVSTDSTTAVATPGPQGGITLAVGDKRNRTPKIARSLITAGLVQAHDVAPETRLQ